MYHFLFWVKKFWLFKDSLNLFEFSSRRESHGCCQQTSKYGTGQDQAKMPTLRSQWTSCKLMTNRAFQNFFYWFGNNFRGICYWAWHEYTDWNSWQFPGCFLNLTLSCRGRDDGICANSLACLGICLKYLLKAGHVLNWPWLLVSRDWN